MKQIPTLMGTGGPFKGEMYVLELYRPYVVGRSRSADISVKRTQKFKLQSDEERDNDVDAQTISARHFQITCYSMQAIEIKNFSENGTLLDGVRIGDEIKIEDLARKAHEIEFGKSGKFKLMLCAHEESVATLPLE